MPTSWLSFFSKARTVFRHRARGRLDREACHSLRLWPFYFSLDQPGPGARAWLVALLGFASYSALAQSTTPAPDPDLVTMTLDEKWTSQFNADDPSVPVQWHDYINGNFHSNASWKWSTNSSGRLRLTKLEEKTSVSGDGNGVYILPPAGIEKEWAYRFALPEPNNDGSPFSFLDLDYDSNTRILWVTISDPSGETTTVTGDDTGGAPAYMGLRGALSDMVQKLPIYAIHFPLDASGAGVPNSLRGHGTFSSMGYSSEISSDLAINFKLPDKKLRISSLQTPITTGNLHSFLPDEPIQLQAALTPAKAGVSVKWTVTGLQGAAGIKGFPASKEVLTDAEGKSKFQFKASDSAEFVKNRHSAWTNGSRAPNPPIAFDVLAVADAGGKPLEARLSEAGLGELRQDDIDTLRQEYYDFRAALPDRAVVVPGLGGNFNRGNYSVQISEDLMGHFNKIQEAYSASSATVDGETVAFPAGAGVIVTVGGGFRNPRLNVAAGSKYPTTSFHTKGRALDLAPLPVSVLVKGRRKTLDLHQVLYPALHRAASTQGSAIAEQGSTVVPVGFCGSDSSGNRLCEDHIHVQW